MRPRASMEAGGDAGASTERRSQRGVPGLCANLEVLCLAFAQPVLDDLGQPSPAELERAERYRIALTLAHTARRDRCVHRDRALTKERHEEIHEVNSRLVECAAQH